MNKEFIIGAILVTILAAAIFETPTAQVGFNDLAITSRVCVDVIRLDGTEEKQMCGPADHNTVQNSGLQWVRDKIAFTNTSGVATTIVLGNYTNAEDGALTTLPGQQNSSSCCGLSPTTGTVVGVGNGNYSVTNLWTVSGCTGGNVLINTTALYNTTANGCTGSCLMFAGKNFSAPVTLQNGDQLNVTWYVWAASG